MYIEFRMVWLPDGTTTAAWPTIGVELHNWAAKYNIKYRQKIIKHTLRVTFDSDDSYMLFAMTWNPTQNELLKYNLIEPMKTRQL